VKKKMWGSMFLILALLTAVCVGQAETLEQAVANAFQAIKERDPDQLQRYFTDPKAILDWGSDIPPDDPVLDALLSQLECKVISSSVSGDTAIAETEITNVDFGAVFDEWFEVAIAMVLAEAMSEEDTSYSDDADELLLSMLKREDNTMRTAIVDIRLKKVPSGWAIDTAASEELQDAIFGGMLSYIDPSEDEFE